MWFTHRQLRNQRSHEAAGLPFGLQGVKVTTVIFKPLYEMIGKGMFGMCLLEALTLLSISHSGPDQPPIHSVQIRKQWSFLPLASFRLWSLKRVKFNCRDPSFFLCAAYTTSTTLVVQTHPHTTRLQRTIRHKVLWETPEKAFMLNTTHTCIQCSAVRETSNQNIPTGGNTIDQEVLVQNGTMRSLFSGWIHLKCRQWLSHKMHNKQMHSGSTLQQQSRPNCSAITSHFPIAITPENPLLLVAWPASFYRLSCTKKLYMIFHRFY